MKSRFRISDIKSLCNQLSVAFKKDIYYAAINTKDKHGSFIICPSCKKKSNMVIQLGGHTVNILIQEKCLSICPNCNCLLVLGSSK